MKGHPDTAEIAAAAARLIVEDGLDWGAAKKRAQRDLGLRRAELPGNELLEDEVRVYLDLYFADTQPAELAALRRVALAWMQRLAGFRPHLAGAVWRGTATRLSAVSIDLYCDDSKAPELALVNERVDYDTDALPREGGGEPMPVLTVASRSAELGEIVTVRLVVRDHDDLRGALKPDARGRPWRGDLAAVERLVAAGGPA